MPKLTVASAKAKGPGRYADGNGLYLIVKPTLSRSWVLRVQEQGRRRDIGLGRFVESYTPETRAEVAGVPMRLRTLLTLADAREKAAHLRLVAKAGLDPIAARDKGREIIPAFLSAMNDTHSELSRGWAPKTAKAFLSSLTLHAVPALGKMRVDHIGANHIRDCLAPIWVTSPVMAEKVRQRIGQVLDFSKVKGWRTMATPLAKEVTAGLANQPLGRNHPAMPYVDVPAYLGRLGGNTLGKLALRLAILTGSRSKEARYANWNDIDVNRGLWKRTAEIMKEGVEHTVTLSPEALEALERARPFASKCGLVFPAPRGGVMSDATLLKALRDSGVKNFTVHGFRSSFRDWAADEMPTVSRQVAEYALSHVVGSATERAYLRTEFTEQRRLLLNAWGRYCEGTATVSDIAAARAAKMGASA